MRLSILGALGALIAAGGVRAQEPKRPRVPGDTNSALVYYELGVRLLQQQPEEAANAFYWASRLNPEWAPAPYARRVALYASDARLLARYYGLTGRMLNSRPVSELDSLLLRAEMLDPFFARDLEAEFLELAVRSQLEQVIERAGGGATSIDVAGTTVTMTFRTEAAVTRRSGAPGQSVDRAYLDNMSRQVLNADGAFLSRAAVATRDGDFAEAADLYHRALPESRLQPQIHADRARAFQRLGEVDSALAELRTAIAKLYRPDNQPYRRVFQSVAAHEYAIGVLLERADRTAEAREAYGRSVRDDPAYFAAYERLGMLRLAAGDTIAAIGALTSAVQGGPREVGPKVTLALVLAQAGRVDDAIGLLQGAVELEPYYPWLRYVLGRVYELKGDAAAATAAYRAYLAAASRNDARRADATQRLARLAPGN